MPLWMSMLLGAPSLAKDDVPPPVSVVGDPAVGKATYAARCSACHGATGKGDGPAARALPRAPPDLTAAAFWEDRTDADIVSVLQNGTPGGVMRPFPMTEPQSAHLVAFLRTLAPPAG